MKKNIIIIFLCLCFKIQSQEIELPQYINHMTENPFAISPSYAGIGSELQFRLNGISQWIGIERAPQTQSLTVSGRFADRFGAGLIFFNDSNGFTKQQGAKLSLASHLTLNQFSDSFLSFALSTNFTQFRINTEYFKGQITESLPNVNEPTINFDVSMLFRYTTFAISLNVANIFNKSNINSISTDEPEILRKYTVYIVYNYKINKNTEFEPSIYTDYFEASKRSRNDINLKLRNRVKNGYIWGGISYSFLNDQFGEPLGVSPMIGLKKDSFYISYAFGINTNKIHDFSYGSHMITLGLDFNRRPSLARCTRNMIMF